MNGIRNIQVKIIDTNGKSKGMIPLNITFEDAGPLVVEYQAANYLFTGKSGTDSDTGYAVRELASDDDARLWITLDGKMIWED